METEQGTGAAVEGRFAHDRFVIRQWVRPMVNKYEVHVATGSGGDGDLVTYVQQKRLKIRERVDFHPDSRREGAVLSLRARKVLEARGRYDVLDEHEEVIGQMHKVFGKSLLRSTWKVLGPAGEEIVMVRESSMGLALWRRFIGLIPAIGGLLAMIPIPYGFDITAEPGLRQLGAPVQVGDVVGRHTRRIGIRDVYDLDLSADAGRFFDRRLAVALAVGLDCLQDR